MSLIRQRHILNGILLLVIVGFTAFLQHSRLAEITTASARPASNQTATSEANTQLQLELLQQIPSFGFQNLVADWVFLSFLQYFGDVDARRSIGYATSPAFFEVIIAKDPLFLDAYIYLTNTVSLYAAQPEKSVALMQAGLEHMSPQVPAGSYFVWRYKGTDELLFLGASNAASHSFLKAAEWAEASNLPQSDYDAQISRRTADFLAQDPNSKPAQLNAWSQVLLNAVDDQIRDLAVSRIEDLGGEIIVNQAGQVTVNFKLDE